MRLKIIKYSLRNALGVMAYAFIVGSFMFLAGNVEATESPLLAIPAFLMLLVFSVALVGSLIFGQPVLWYMGGRKKDSILLLSYTLIILFMLTILVFFFLFIF